MGPAKARTIEIALSLIDEQVAYHRARLSNMRAAGGRVAILAEAFFALTFLVSLGKLLFVFDVAGRWFKPGGLLGAFLSAGAGALVGLRAYSEFSLLARQSTVMLRMLEAARADLAAVEVAAAQPLGSLALGKLPLSDDDRDVARGRRVGGTFPDEDDRNQLRRRLPGSGCRGFGTRPLGSPSRTR